MNIEKLHQESHESGETLKPKYATRAVLFDENNRVAIINVTKHGYYKIPGGGIEDNESIQDAARREVSEESGCNSVILDELGRLETAIPIWNTLDISDGFIARVVGEKSTPKYEDWEDERGFQLEWFSDLDKVIETIEGNIVKEPGIASLQERDLAFLKMAKEKLTNSTD